MQLSLKAESEKLARSWMQHAPAKLRDYLVAGVEDPRMNLQSVFSRHFLLRSLFGEKFSGLMEQECRFAAVMNWLTALAANSDAEELSALLHALRRGADNAEGLQIPRFILRTFTTLPLSLGPLEIPNYIETLLHHKPLTPALSPSPTGSGQADGEGEALLSAGTADALNTFEKLWQQALTGEIPPDSSLTVLEPACGSANDYRFLHSYGLTRFLDYTGLDLCPANIQNARTLFPDAHFEVGNVFELNAPDGAFELAFVHDLFEHLSLEGLQTAVKELCRVTRRAICANFFQMDEIPDHILRPVDEYHWNLLSMDEIKKLFGAHGFSAQVIQIRSFLRQELGCEYTHNPNAYTFLLQRDASAEIAGSA